MKACNSVFAKYKDMGIDIFDITEGFYEKYPKVEIKDIINKTELQVEAEVEIIEVLVFSV